MAAGLNTIPDWDFSGLLPARDISCPTSTARSPYSVSLCDLVVRFGDTEPRHQLLQGLLDYRAELHKAGLVCGFQWIGGSFTEEAEVTRGQPPKDIDLVTFIYMPEECSAESFVDSFWDFLTNGWESVSPRNVQRNHSWIVSGCSSTGKN